MQLDQKRKRKTKMELPKRIGNEKRDQLKENLSEENLGPNLYPIFDAWKKYNGIGRTSELTKTGCQAAWDIFIGKYQDFDGNIQPARDTFDLTGYADWIVPSAGYRVKPGPNTYTLDAYGNRTPINSENNTATNPEPVIPETTKTENQETEIKKEINEMPAEKENDILSEVRPFVGAMVIDKFEAILEEASKVAIADADNLKAQIEKLKADHEIDLRKAKANAARVQVPAATGTDTQIEACTEIEELPYGKILNIKGNAQTSKVKLRKYNSVFAPAIDDDFIWGDMTKPFCGAINRGTHVFLSGPAGTGKTTMAQQFAARTGRPYSEIIFHEEMSSFELIGNDDIDQKTGKMIWKDGSLLKAIRIPNNVILLDEIGLGRPSLTSGPLMQILASNQITLGNGDVVFVAPGVTFIAASNDDGTGDNAGTFAGIRPINSALLSRFRTKLTIDYLPAQAEQRALRDRANIPMEMAKAIVAFAKLTRDMVKAGRLENAIGFRAMCEWGALAYHDEIPSKNAFEYTILNGAQHADKATYFSEGSANADHDLIDAIAKGEQIQTQTETRMGFEEIPAANLQF